VPVENSVGALMVLSVGVRSLAEAGFRDTCFSETSTTPSMSVVTGSA
jgi:hypothetical protein